MRQVFIQLLIYVFMILLQGYSVLLGNVYISDNGNSRVRKITVSTGIISTIAGTGAGSFSGDGGQATSASFYYPLGIALDGSGMCTLSSYRYLRLHVISIA